MGAIMNVKIAIIAQCTLEPRYNQGGVVPPCYNEDLWITKVTLLYQVSRYIRVKKKEI